MTDDGYQPFLKNLKLLEHDSKPLSVEDVVSLTCFCKLKEFCTDKNGPDCMRHRNLYAEFMAKRID